MSRILVTGARGFIGQNLCKLLHAKNHTVLGLGHGHLSPDQFAELGLTAWVNGNVDFANLQQIVADGSTIDVIYHLAGGSHVGRSFSNPFEDFQRTVVSTSQLLEWARLNQPSAKIVVTSSAAVYGAGHQPGIPESAVRTPFSPYGAHKAMQEDLCLSYGKNFGLPISIVRLFSVYGEGLRKQLIFDLCQKLVSAPGQIVLNGTGEETRDWLHVDDVCQLLDQVRDVANEHCYTVNGGSGAGTSVRVIAETMIHTWQLDTKLEFSNESRRGDPVHLVCDATKLKSSGFTPSVSLDRGLERFVAWFQSEVSR